MLPSSIASTFRRVSFLLAMVPALSLSAHAQKPQMNRVADAKDLSAMTRMTGQLPTWVNPARDAGPAQPETEVGITLIMARAPEQEAAFVQLLADQTNPASPRYHQWLTPAQIGAQFGPTQHDVDAVVAWATASGLTLHDIAPSRMFLHVSGPTTAAAATFQTSFRMFNSLGKAHLSANSEPSIPTALMPVIAGVAGLTDFDLQPQSHMEQAPARPAAGTPSPQYTSSGGTHYVFPKDFATIFDINPLYNAGINGTGQKVAIIGRSQVSVSDMTAFESLAGLSNNVPNIIIAATGNNPGTVAADEGESDLDLQRVIGVAPGVTADFVISGSANGYNGIYVAAQYEVQTVMDPVLTLSYGACEANAGSSGVSLWSTLFQQAAAEGITVFVSSADSGAATCDGQFVQAPATQIRSINYICSNPYTTCVGGTEMVDTASPTTYWATTNGPGYSSALGYIPEGGWNDPTQVNNGVTSYVVEGSGGGASTIVAKPAYQTGVGVPADTFRDVPDVSFPASGHDGYYGCQADLVFSNGSNADCSKGSGVIFAGTSAAAPGWAGVAALLNQKAGVRQGNLNPLIYRLAANTANGAFHDVTPATTGITNCDVTVPSLCNNSTPAPNSLTGGLVGYPVTVGYDQVTGWGSADVAKFVAAAIVPYQATTLTLSATPTTITTAQPVTFTATLATSGSGTPTGTVQFYSNGNALGSAVTLTSGTTASSGLQNFTTPGTYSITAVYSGDTIFVGSTSAAYSLIVTSSSKPATTTTLTASATTATSQQNVAFSASVTSTTAGTPTGTVQFYSGASALGSAIALSGNTANLPSTTYGKGTYTITAVYSGDANYAASTSNIATLTISTVASTSTLTATATSGSVLQSIGFTDKINVTTGTPTGTAMLMVDNVARGSAVTLSGGVATFAPALLVSGTHSYTVVYSGDTVFSGSTSNAVSITLTAVASSTALGFNPSTFTTAQSTVATFTVTGVSGGPTPTGSVTLMYNGASQGTLQLASGTASGTISSFTVGTYVFSALYSGDTVYSASTSANVTVTVTVAPSFTIASTPGSISFTAGAATGNTTALTYTSVNGFVGPITATCSIVPASGTASIAPTCSATGPTLAAGGTGNGTVTVNTIAPHGGTAPVSLAANTPTATRKGMLGGVALAALLLIVSPTRRRLLRNWRSMSLILFLTLSLAAISGCGGGGNAPKTGGTTTGSYTMTVTGTSGSTTAQVVIPVTIQ